MRESAYCSRCHKVKAAIEFSRDPSKPRRGLASRCRPCNRKYMKKYYRDAVLKNPARRNESSERYRKSESARRAARNRDMIKRNGITVEQYERMHARQKGLCAICNRPSSVKRNSLAVDH